MLGGFSINKMRPHVCLLILLSLLIGCVPGNTQIISTSVHISVSPTQETQLPKLTETASVLKPTTTTVSPTPVWSNNLLVAYIKDSIDPDYQDDNALYISDSKGQNQINIFNGLSGKRGGDFSWSPSGNWLLFSEYESEPNQNNTNTTTPYNLWTVRSDRTQRRKLLVTDGYYPVRWAKNKDIFLINCDIGIGDLEICIVNPENGEIIKTGNVGTDPKFSPDGKKYAFIHGDKEIYIADTNQEVKYQIFSTEDQLHDFSWTNDGAAIITAIIHRQGCGNKNDGSSTIIKVDMATRQVSILRELNWSFYEVDLSPDQHYILSNWHLCVGNTYNLAGVIGLDNDLVTWPLHNFTSYEWSYDGKYLLANYYFFGDRYFIDPITGNYVGEFKPPFLDSLLPADNSYASYWVAQPVVK